MTFYEKRVTEPKLSKDGTHTVRTVKLGNKVIGHIEVAKLKLGSALAAGIYWGSGDTMRLSHDNQAIKVTRTAISGLKMYGVVFIGRRFPDGRSYTMPLDTCSALPSEPGKPYVTVSRELWIETLPPEELRVAAVMGKMRVAGRGAKSSVT